MNDDAATAAGEADNAGQENDVRGGDDGDDDEDDDKWGRGAWFNSSSSSSSSGRRPPRQRCHCHRRLAAVGHRGARDRRPTPRTPEAKKKKDIERVYKKMTAEEKNDLMRKLAELDAEDANDDESAPPSPTPM